MKLALCLFKYFPFGGLQRDFMRIATEALSRGHTIDVFTMEWEGETNPNFNLHIIPRKGLQNHTQNANFANNIQHFLPQYDLVLGFNKMPGLDVYYAADICYQSKMKKSRRFMARLTPRYRTLTSLEKAVFAKDHQTKILLLSTLQQEEFTECYQTAENRFYLLPPGISKDRIAPDNAQEIREKTRALFHIQQNDYLLLMVGSGFKTKGLDRILHAIAALDSNTKARTKLFVIGQDNPKSYIKEAKKLGIFSQCYFLGGRSDVPRFFLASDLLVHPAYHENTGTVLLEALASGLPVLTTEVCGYAKYITAANAGRVISSPFLQATMNFELQSMLLGGELTTWRKNAIQFTKNADIYDLPKYAVDYLETVHKDASFKKYPFEKMMALQGQVYRRLEGRSTERVIVNDEAYFIKKHSGVGFKEILKNLFQLRLPILSAKNEKFALTLLKKLNIPAPEMIAYEKKGLNPAKIRSYILTRELPKHVSLEHFCANWQKNPPKFSLKQSLIKEVARISRIMHTHGMNHRDFYICHFLLDDTLLRSSEIKLYLIDLHRACIRKYVPMRWLIKDLAGLFFSSKDIGLTKRDLLRFIKEYRNKSLLKIFPEELTFWQKVEQRGNKLYGQQQR